MRNDSLNDSETEIFYMESPYGVWVWDPSIKEPEVAIQMFPNPEFVLMRRDLYELLLKDPMFMDNRNRNFQVSERPDLFFSQFIPRNYVFNADYKVATSWNEIPYPNWLVPKP